MVQKCACPGTSHRWRWEGMRDGDYTFESAFHWSEIICVTIAPPPLKRWGTLCPLQDEAGEVFVFDRVVQSLSDVIAGDGDLFLVQVRGLEADRFEGSLEDRVEASGADVGRSAVHVVGNLRDGFDGVV